MSWTPEPDPSAGWSPDPEPGDTPPEAVLFTNVAFQLRIAPVQHERCKAGEQAFATYLAEPGHETQDEARPVAVGMLPSAAVAALLESNMFAAPAPFMMRAVEEEGGRIQAVLSALLPQSVVERFNRRLLTDNEPWSASVPVESEPIPGVDDVRPDGEEGDPLVPFALGALFRFTENRKHPTDLTAEAADLFITVLSGGAMDADAKKIDNLISGL